MSNLTLDVGLAAKLKVAFARNDWTERLIDAACEGDKLGQFRQVLLGRAVITQVEHVINCDADPFNPWANDGFTIEEHQKGGQWKFDPKQVEFFLASGQKGGNVIESNKLRKELAKKLVFNANVLDYLLAHPELILNEWKTDGNGNTRYTFFWGTIYRDRDGGLYVRCLCWVDGRWNWSIRWLFRGWGGNGPAAVRAS
jgi:hypothetical protein